MSALETLLLSHLAVAKVEKPEREVRFAPPRRWRFDLAWPARKLAVEIDGGTWVRGRHSRGAGFAKDCEKLNAAAILGWRVLRFDNHMVRDGRALATIEAALKDAA